MYRWYITPDKLSRMFKIIPNTCWKCLQEKGTFYHLWLTCKKTKKFWDMIHKTIQKILNVNIMKKTEFYLLGLMEEDLQKKHGKLLLNMITAARIIFAQQWKEEYLPMIEEWIIKVIDLAQMAKLTEMMKDKSLADFKRT